MTRAIRGRILKDANGDISDHLGSHIHLTNCIHLKNHMHRNSPMLDERSLVRDLSVLQRSRSLRDPSTSPPTWHSPFTADTLPKQPQKDATARDRRCSEGRRGRRLSMSGNSPPVAILGTSKVAPGEVTGKIARSDHSSRTGVRKGKQIYREGSDQNIEGPPVDLVQDAVSRDGRLKDGRNKQKGKKHKKDAHLKTLSEQLHEISMGSDGVASSHIQINGRHASQDGRVRSNCNGLNRARKRKLHGARRSRASVPSQDTAIHSEFSVASNSFAQVSEPPMYQQQEGSEHFYRGNVTRAPKSACGIPFNWSRIHHRGRTILDRAGKSFSCGLADSRSKKNELLSPGRDPSDMSVASDHTRSSVKSDAEALPLLIEAPGSQVSSEHAAWAHDYSGELGIFSDHLAKHDFDSDLASEARSGQQVELNEHRHHRHQNLTQKYMPRTFKDLVGQNLVAQALANAVAKRKVGFLYIFYGPHGTGKTSCARIFARALNCQSLEYEKPCGFCNFCTAHMKGQSRYVREVGPVSNFDFENILDLLENTVVSNPPSQYRVFIFDDCDALSSDCWSAMSKVIERAPRRMVFILVSSSLDSLPHIIISRCQKFFFPKLKDADIIYVLQWIALKEGLDINGDALKLIASRSDGSLRDAEMTLEQLSLLGQRISVPLVQELVGLVSDDKLVDLLDLALSADTVNTVKALREIMETGVEPLTLMSQLATVITDILAGIYDFRNKRPRRKFFQQPMLSKAHMEKLRQALKILSEAEKQLRMSNEKLTWLTAALLQLAPDQQYMLPSSSADTTLNQSPSALFGDTTRRSNADEGVSSKIVKAKILDAGNPVHIYSDGKMKGTDINRKRLPGTASASQQTPRLSSDVNSIKGKRISNRSLKEIEEIWLRALQMIQSDNLREFMCREGKLMSVSFGAAPMVQLMFGSHPNKSIAEKFQGQILQAFEAVLGSPVIIEIRGEVGHDSSSQMIMDSNFTNTQLPRVGFDDVNKNVMKERCRDGVHATHFRPLNSESLEAKSEIVEITDSPGVLGTNEPKKATTVSSPGRKFGEQNRSQSLVRGKVSLAHVIQQSEGWSRRKAVSIAEKLEQENLRLEPRSRSLLCWKASKVTRNKLSRVRTRKRKPHSLLKLFPCGKCLSSKSHKRN